MQLYFHAKRNTRTRLYYENTALLAKNFRFPLLSSCFRKWLRLFSVVYIREAQDNFPLTYFSHFNNFKKVPTQTSHNFTHPPNIHVNLFILIIIFKTNNAYRNHHTNPKQSFFITIKEYYENKYFHDFFYPLIKLISTKQKYIITARIP